jgi:hypothetical protein
MGPVFKVALDYHPLRNNPLDKLDKWGGLEMKANKWVAVLAAGSMLAIAAPLSAQFGGFKSLKKAMDTVAKELEQPKPAPQPQPTARPTPPQSRPATSQGGYASPAPVRTPQITAPPPPQENSSAMIARWSDLHDACRSGAGRRDAEGYPLVCNDRDTLTETLTQNGWCRGGGDPTWTGDDEWQRCSVAVKESQISTIPDQNWECTQGFMDTTVRVNVINITRRDNKATGDYEVRGIPDESSINGLIESGTVFFDDETYEFTAQNIIQKVSDDVHSYFHSKRLRIDNTSDKRELREIFSPSRLKFFEEAEEGADVWEQSCTLE